MLSMQSEEAFSFGVSGIVCVSGNKLDFLELYGIDSPDEVQAWLIEIVCHFSIRV